MKQITRINNYEEILNNANNILNKFKDTFTEYKNIQPKINTLDKYYGSEEWYQDVVDYDEKRIPNNIKAGILSEDAIYDMLTNNREIALNLLEIATSILKNNK